MATYLEQLDGGKRHWWKRTTGFGKWARNQRQRYHRRRLKDPEYVAVMKYAKGYET